MNLVPGEPALIDLLAREARGPRRNSLFAVWLTLRACADPIAAPYPQSDRNRRRRLQAIRKRIGSLTIPVALRRTIHDITDDLSDDLTPQRAVEAIERLRTVTRDLLGPAAAAAVAETLHTVSAVAAPESKR